MALITCPECGKKVSDSATACPGCAYPLKNSSSSSKRVQTIEKTSKKWKGLQLIGFIFAMIGLLMVFGSDPKSGATPGVAVLLLAVGIVLYLYARLGSWWHHD